jgi:thymidylate synthase
MKQYHNLLETILSKGTLKDASRDNMPKTISLFGGVKCTYDLSKGFPILTTKKISFKTIATELLWFLRGDTNIKYLVDNKCNIWNEDAYAYYCKVVKKFSKQTEEPPFTLLMDDPNENKLRPLSFSEFIACIKENKISSYGNYTLGDCGVQYGELWRRFKGVNGDGDVVVIDQIKEVIRTLKTMPESRRHIIVAWNPCTLDDMALNACHTLVQFNCRKVSIEERSEIATNLLGNYDTSTNVDYMHKWFDKYNIPKYHLDCEMYQRSADSFLGVPYNISSYALLTEMLCKIENMIPGQFIHSFGDAHIYENHVTQVKEILSRDTEKYSLPKLVLNNEINWQQDFDELLKEDNLFSLENYQSYDTIKAELSTGINK